VLQLALIWTRVVLLALLVNKASNASTVAMRPITLVGSTWQKISQECRSVVMRALDLDDTQRPSAAELQQSAWFDQVTLHPN